MIPGLAELAWNQVQWVVVKQDPERLAELTNSYGWTRSKTFEHRYADGYAFTVTTPIKMTLRQLQWDTQFMVKDICDKKGQR